MSETDKFAAALERAGGTTVVVDSRADALEQVRCIVGERVAVVDGHPDLDGATDELSVTNDPWQADVGITGAVAAVAETGTLALVYDARRPRGTSLVPMVHVALVPLDRMVPSYPDAISVLARQRPVPSGMQLITGPSSSRDIEMTSVKGVHGPKEVHVVFFPPVS